MDNQLIYMKKTGQRIAVVDSTQVWLSQTMTWLYTQVKCLPPRFESHVVCDYIQNLNQFPIQSLVSAERDWWFWRFLGSKSWQASKWRRSRLLLDQVLASQAQILHSHFGDRGWANIATAARAGLKHVVTFYGYDVSRLPFVAPEWRARYQDLFAAADLLLCEGSHLADCLVGLGCPQEKVKVHHLSVNLDRIAFRPRRWHHGQPLRVLIVGSFVEKKASPVRSKHLAASRTELRCKLPSSAMRSIKTEAKRRSRISLIPLPVVNLAPAPVCSAIGRIRRLW